MKINVLIAAAIAAGAMTISSHAKDASAEAKKATESAEASAGESVNPLQQLLRAGNAVSRIKVDGVEQVPLGRAKVQPASVDPKVTGSTRVADAATTARKVAPTKETAAGRPYHSIVSRYAAHYGVPVSLAHAVISIESNYRVSARGRAGEIGLMQIKPSTARAMGYSGSAKGLYSPENNIKYGMKYLGEAFKLGGGNTCTAILKYNAGHGAKRMNPTSSAYCTKVKRILGTG